VGNPEAEVSVYYCFARSGGTLINRCLGCIPGNLVLSEVNPMGSIASVESQARDWLGLVAAGEFEQFAGKSYGEKISLLADAATGSGKRLIIRDWPTLNFLSGIHWGYFFPSGVLEQDFYLDRHVLRRHSAVISRRSASVYESLKRSFPHLKELSVDDFSSAYLAYAEAVASFQVIHFEEFCEAPVREFGRLCQALNCSFSDHFVTAFRNFVNCTGDNNLAAVSRGGSSNRIVPLTDNRESPAWRAATRDERCREADQIFGYVQ
jgi:hypothetical protein